MSFCSAGLRTGFKKYDRYFPTDLYKLKTSNKLFLSGGNHAWHWYGYDFGNGQFNKAPGQAFRDNVDVLSQNGGNILRVWLHTVGEGWVGIVPGKKA